MPTIKQREDKVVQPDDRGPWTPIPDPTTLTIQTLQREIATLKELLQTNMDSMRALLDVRVSNVDESSKQRCHSLEQRVEIIKTDEVGRINDLLAEKFISISERFSELDKRHDQNLDYSKRALADALEAQKESVVKTENSFTKQIDQMQILVNTIAKTTDEKIDDLRERFTLTEGKSTGRSDSWAFAVAAGGIVLGAIGAFSVFFK